MGGPVFHKRTVRDVPLDNEVVLVHVDYAVPRNENGEIIDDFRVKASLPTIQHLLSRGSTVVLVSSVRDTAGSVVIAPSLESVAERLRQVAGRPVTFVPACVGDVVKTAVRKAPRGSLLLLENTAHHRAHAQSDADFAQKLAESTGARYFVQDVLNGAHHPHALNHAITFYIPSVAGLALEREYETFRHLLGELHRPSVTPTNSHPHANYELRWVGNDGRERVHISTGGASALHLIRGGKLIAVESLLDKPR